MFLGVGALLAVSMALDVRRCRDDNEAKMRRRTTFFLGLGIAAAAMILTLVATRSGLRVSHDSVTYLSMTRNVAAGHGFVDFTGEKVTNFPPGLPGVLAAGLEVGVDPETVARYLNAVAVGSITLMTFLLLRRHSQRALTVLGGTAAVGLAPPLLRVSDFLLSEPLFIVFVLGFILSLEKAVIGRGDSQPKERLWLVAAGLLAGCSFIVRYSGTALVLTGLVVLVIYAWDQPSVLLRKLGLFGLFAGLLPVAWMLRNASTGNDLFGPRFAARSGGLFDQAGSALRGAAASIGEWFAPRGAPVPLRWLVLVSAAGLLAALPLFAVRAIRGNRSADEMSWRDLGPLAVYVLVYVAFVTVSWWTGAGDLDARILAPAYPALVVIAAVSLERVHAMLRARDLAGLAAAAVVVSLVWLGLSVGLGLWTARVGEAADRGATRRASPLAKAVKQVDSRAPLYSNDPWALYFVAGRQPVALAPGELQPGQSHRPESLNTFARVVRCSGPVLLAWFDPEIVAPRRGAVPFEKLRRAFQLTRLSDVDDGSLFRVSARDNTLEFACPKPPQDS